MATRLHKRPFAARRALSVEYIKPSISEIKKPEVLTNDKEMTPFIGALIGSGISAISGSVNNLFSGEGRERRQTRRAERKERRAVRKETRAGVIRGRIIKPSLPPVPTRPPTTADIKPARAAVPVGMWFQENWYFVAGGAAVLFLIIWLFGRKKKK
ncbi:hypothetical protein ES705_25248 [subsurface metagenome]